MNKSAIGQSWEEAEKELFSPEEIAESHARVKLIGELIKARQELGWRPVWSSAEAIERTARWYRSFYESGCLDTADDLDRYLRTAQEKGLPWTK